MQKHSGALYIPTKIGISTCYIECDPILHEYYITRGTKYILQDMNDTKNAHELLKENPASRSKESRKGSNYG